MFNSLRPETKKILTTSVLVYIAGIYAARYGPLDLVLLPEERFLFRSWTDAELRGYWGILAAVLAILLGCVRLAAAAILDICGWPKSRLNPANWPQRTKDKWALVGAAALAVAGGFMLGRHQENLAQRAEWLVYPTALMLLVAVNVLTIPAVMRLVPGACTK